MISTEFNTVALVALGFLPGLVHGFWRMSCSVIQTGRVDPVISYGTVSQHVHKISGAANININSTFESLASSSCTSCEIQADKSAYWTPQLYYLHSSGLYEEVPNNGMAVYYLGRGMGPNGSSAQPFPPGLKMMSGNNYARSYNDTAMTWGNSTYPSRPLADRVSFACIDYNNPMAQTPGLDNTTCPDGLRAQIQIQSCWNGVDLYLPDQSHVDYLSQIDNGVCPPTHPILLPHLFYEVLYSVTSFDPATDGGKFVFANGDESGYGFHGDFISGWDSSTLQSAIDTCLVGNPDGVISECPALNSSDINDYSSLCPERSPVFPCETVHGIIGDALPGCITPTGPGPDSDSALTTCPGGNTAACSSNYNTYGPEVSSGNAFYSSIGCYTEATNGRALNVKSYSNSSNTVEDCLAFCAGAAFAGVEYGQECYCGQQLNAGSVPANASDCDMTCSGNQFEFCGGRSRLNVYRLQSSSSSSWSTASGTPTAIVAVTTSVTTIPSPTTPYIVQGNANFTYYACVNEPLNSRALSTQLPTPNPATIENCLEAAAAYAWVGIEYGGECWAGMELNQSSASSPNATDQSICDMTCTGNTEEICGGPLLLTMYKRTAPLPPQTGVFNGTSLGFSYYGCVEEPAGGRLLGSQLAASDDMTVEECLKLVGNDNNDNDADIQYVGVEYGRECWAGPTLLAALVEDGSGPLGGCDMPCEGNALEWCGGSNRLNLYEVL